MIFPSACEYWLVFTYFNRISHRSDIKPAVFLILTQVFHQPGISAAVLTWLLPLHSSSSSAPCILRYQVFYVCSTLYHFAWYHEHCLCLQQFYNAVIFAFAVLTCVLIVAIPFFTSDTGCTWSLFRSAPFWPHRILHPGDVPSLSCIKNGSSLHCRSFQLQGWFSNKPLHFLVHEQGCRNHSAALRDIRFPHTAVQEDRSWCRCTSDCNGL